MPPTPIGPLPLPAMPHPTLPLGAVMPDTDALLLWAEEELRRRRALGASVGSRPMKAPPTPPVGASAPVVAMAVQLGSRALGEAPEAGAMGPLAGEPIGAVLPGVTAARVGLLPGLRTSDMLKYNGEVPKQKRKPPTDLTGLTNAQRVERRKQQAREYSKRAREREKEMKDEIAKEVVALGFVRDVFEMAPHVCMVLSGDVRTTNILYANDATKKVLHVDPQELLGRSLWDIVHPDDRSRICMFLGQLVLAKSGVASLHCRVRTSFADYFLPMDMTLKYGSLGIMCSLWKGCEGGKGAL